MKENKVILHADDHLAYREYYKKALSEKYNYHTAKDGAELYKIYSELKPDLIIADLDIPVIMGIEVLEKIRKIDQTVKLVVLTGREERFLIKKAIGLNLSGYHFKSSTSFDDFVDSIEKALKGISTFDERVIEAINTKDNERALTLTELKILNFISQGMQTEEIAKATETSVNTINSHRQKILEKLNCVNFPEAIRKVYEENLYKLN